MRRAERHTLQWRVCLLSKDLGVTYEDEKYDTEKENQGKIILDNRLETHPKYTWVK